MSFESRRQAPGWGLCGLWAAGNTATLEGADHGTQKMSCGIQARGAQLSGRETRARGRAEFRPPGALDRTYGYRCSEAHSPGGPPSCRPNWTKQITRPTFQLFALWNKELQDRQQTTSSAASRNQMRASSCNTEIGPAPCSPGAMQRGSLLQQSNLLRTRWRGGGGQPASQKPGWKNHAGAAEQPNE